MWLRLDWDLNLRPNWRGLLTPESKPLDSALIGGREWARGSGEATT
jgi:hypothetical protein